MGILTVVVSRMGPHPLSVFCASDTVIFTGLIDKGKAFYTLKIYLAAIAVRYIDYWDETAR